MSKIQKYIGKLNKKILPKIDYPKLTEDSYRNSIADKMKSAFAETYGKQSVSMEDTEDDDGFAVVPALLRVSDGTEYLALLDICVLDSGEHYGTSLLHPEYGVIKQTDFRAKMKPEEVKAIFPYKYLPLVQIEGDIHTGNYFSKENPGKLQLVCFMCEAPTDPKEVVYKANVSVCKACADKHTEKEIKEKFCPLVIVENDQ